MTRFYKHYHNASDIVVCKNLIVKMNLAEAYIYMYTTHTYLSSYIYNHSRHTTPFTADRSP